MQPNTAPSPPAVQNLVAPHVHPQQVDPVIPVSQAPTQPSTEPVAADAGPFAPRHEDTDTMSQVVSRLSSPSCEDNPELDATYLSNQRLSKGKELDARRAEAVVFLRQYWKVESGRGLQYRPKIANNVREALDRYIAQTAILAVVGDFHVPIGTHDFGI